MSTDRSFHTSIELFASVFLGGDKEDEFPNVASFIANSLYAFFVVLPVLSNELIAAVLKLAAALKSFALEADPFRGVRGASLDPMLLRGVL